MKLGVQFLTREYTTHVASNYINSMRSRRDVSCVVRAGMTNWHTWTIWPNLSVCYLLFWFLICNFIKLCCVFRARILAILFTKLWNVPNNFYFDRTQTFSDCRGEAKQRFWWFIDDAGCSYCVGGRTVFSSRPSFCYNHCCWLHCGKSRFSLSLYTQTWPF